MAGIAPWGRLDYLMKEIGERSWTCFTAASFEERCLCVPELLKHLGILKRLEFIKLKPPSDSIYAAPCQLGIEEVSSKFLEFPSVGSYEAGLLDSLSGPLSWMEACVEQSSSVVLDISTMPKRYFMFLVNKLMDNPRVDDLVVTYTKPSSYPEGPLAVDHDPLSSLDGFMREDERSGSTMTIIGGGFVQFSLSEYLEQSRGSEVNIVMPFPPGSPSARRNWNLMHRMDPNIEMRAHIRRVYAMDFFHALKWMQEVVADCGHSRVDLIPLGPKPHSLAMAMTYRKNRAKASVIYAQPHSYRPDYSVGVALADDGFPEVYAYCLKRNRVDYA